jgi:excisionase family DNA binding protein
MKNIQKVEGIKIKGLSNLSGKTKTEDTCSLKIEWMTTNQAAEYLSLPVSSLRNMASNGQVPYCKLGNRNRYRLEDLRQLLLNNKRGV